MNSSLEKSARNRVFVLGLLARILGACKPAQLGHPNIQQQDMRLKSSHSTQHLAAIRCFTHDPNVFLRQGPAEPLPNEGMSVSDEYRDRLHTARKYRSFL